MADMDKNNMLYRPDLKPDRHYESYAVFGHRTKTHNNVPPGEVPIPDRNNPQVIKHDLKKIVELFTAMPPDVQFYKESIEKIIKRLDVIYPNETEKPAPDDPKIPEIVTPPAVIIPDVNHFDDDVVDDPELPDLFPAPLPLDIKMEQPKTLVEIIQEDYDRDQVHLDAYYTQKLQLVMQNYFQQMLMVMANSGLDDIDTLTRDFDGETVYVPTGKNLEHLRDYIVRSQAVRKQRTAYIKKTHSVDNTMQHVRAWHAAEAQLERYYAEEYGDSGEYLDSHSNALLRESREQYNANYKTALYNMYRYLDSSVIMISDVLNMTVKEAQAKGKLLKEGINVFDTAEAEEAGYGMQTVTAVQSSDSGAANTSSSSTSEPSSSSSSSSTTNDLLSGLKDVGTEILNKAKGQVGNILKENIQNLADRGLGLFGRQEADQ